MIERTLLAGLLGGVILLFSSLSCAEPNAGEKVDVENFDKSKVRREVHDMMQDYVEAIREGGLLAEFRYLDQSDEFFWVPPGYNSAIDYGQVADILNINAKRYKWIDNSWVKLTVFPLDNDIASYHGLVTSTMLDTAGMVTRHKMVESGLVIRREAGWKILSGQTALVETSTEEAEPE